jgi:hypothetical protein
MCTETENLRAAASGSSFKVDRPGKALEGSLPWADDVRNAPPAAPGLRGGGVTGGAEHLVVAHRHVWKRVKGERIEWDGFK